MTVPLPVHGVDISHHQKNIRIDWRAMRLAGVQWMYHKATEGATIRDTAYSTRRAQAKEAGLPFGAYAFARPDGNDARLEARFFIDNAKPAPGDLRPCLDLETKQFVSGMALVDWADAFCDEIKQLVGQLPIVYTPYTLSQELEDATIFWVPRYNNQNERPFRDWDIWQFSNGQLGVPNRVDGLGHVDLNYSPKVTIAELDLDRPAPVPPSRGRKVEEAIQLLDDAKAKPGSQRESLLKKAGNVLKSIKPIR